MLNAILEDVDLVVQSRMEELELLALNLRNQKELDRYPRQSSL